ncbi:MAG TPA: hypothetical protein VKV05_12570 [Terriglobales bacterium]|nr:hypothetical protein [Terriglobales bacterium]
MKTAILAAIAVLAVITLSACGGSSTPPPPPSPTVTVSPATANVQEGSTQQFTATVSNTSATTVNWQVNGITGGNTKVGTISSTGLYTAPDIVPTPASVTITAVLQADTAISGNAIVTIAAVVFNNSSLKGTYVFSLSGIDFSGFAFYAAGAIVADGNGHITGGEEDLNDVSSGYQQATTIAGSYSVGSDGRGTLTFTNSISSGPFSFSFALRAQNTAVLNETDNNVVAATGNLEQQATGVTPPSGNYAFGYSGTGPCGPLNSVGIFTLSGAALGGAQDLNCNGAITQGQSLAGSYTTLDIFGRGTGRFTATVGSGNFAYYAVSAGRFRFVCTNQFTFFLGTADLQTQPSFATSNFSGSYVVSTSANTSNGISFTLIQFNASGGNVSSGHYDVNDTGTVGQASLSGAYSVNSNGRIGGTFNVNGASLPFAMYLISPGRAYYLDERTSATGGGNVYIQASAVTSNAAWAGSYATKQFGYVVTAVGILPNNASSVSGQISADGNGTLAGTLDFNDPNGVFQNQTLQGTYSVGNVAPGRTTLSITTSADGTRNYVGYIVDATRVLLLETDTTLTSGGDAVRQF